ncbi:carbohydrate sulfotransferase 15-like [Amphiura filiformis]|uniref:carbohydrate sulfotransferase 15-like n=1 Tax=Amphiura filiformis TaxID=82378 RepID=UPI003B22566E
MAFLFFKYRRRRRLVVLVVCSLVIANYIALKLYGYDLTSFKQDEKRFDQSPWQQQDAGLPRAQNTRHENIVGLLQNQSDLEHVESHRTEAELDWDVGALSKNMTTVSIQQNMTSLLNINFRADNLKLGNGIKDHAVKSLELKFVLQQFEAWKIEHFNVISNREVPLKLPPPPHVNNSSIWDKMLTIFPLVFRRLMRPFLTDYKNPCFREDDGSLRCLPYFIEIGAAKCGSTDLYYHITRHPQIVQLYKEPHFWTHMAKSDKSITKYLNTLRKFNKALVTQRDNKSLIFGDASPSYFWDNNRIPRNKNRQLLFVWADVVHAVMPGAKIILILRNPIDRTISDYFYSGRHQSPADLHKNVQVATKLFNACLKQHSYRDCATGTTKYYPRLHISVYIAHVREWLRLYPREQVLIIRTEDWHDHAKNDMLQQIYKFLEIDGLSEAELPDLKEDSVLKEIESKKATEKKSKNLGNVLPETRAYLKGFFEPHNRELADYLGDEGFLWKD